MTTTTMTTMTTRLRQPKEQKGEKVEASATPFIIHGNQLCRKLNEALFTAARGDRRFTTATTAATATTATTNGRKVRGGDGGGGAGEDGTAVEEAAVVDVRGDAIVMGNHSW